jgi:hypothetical protein
VPIDSFDGGTRGCESGASFRASQTYRRPGCVATALDVLNGFAYAIGLASSCVSKKFSNLSDTAKGHEVTNIRVGIGLNGRTGTVNGSIFAAGSLRAKID